MLGDLCGVDAKNVTGFVLCEHGSTSFIPWNTVNIVGVPFDQLKEQFNLEEQPDKEKLLHDDTLVFSLRKVTINAPPDSGALGHCLVESLLQIFFYLLTLFSRQHLINAEVILHAVITRLLIQLRKSG